MLAWMGGARKRQSLKAGTKKRRKLPSSAHSVPHRDPEPAEHDAVRPVPHSGHMRHLGALNPSHAVASTPSRGLQSATHARNMQQQHTADPAPSSQPKPRSAGPRSTAGMNMDLLSLDPSAWGPALAASLTATHSRRATPAPLSVGRSGPAAEAANRQPHASLQRQPCEPNRESASADAPGSSGMVAAQEARQVCTSNGPRPPHSSSHTMAADTTTGAASLSDSAVPRDASSCDAGTGHVHCMIPRQPTRQSQRPAKQRDAALLRSLDISMVSWDD